MSLTILDVQTVNGHASGAVQLPAFAVNPQAGDLIVVAVSRFQSSGDVATVASLPTDTAGNTYIVIGSHAINNSNQTTLHTWYAKNITGGSTFRVTVTPGPAFTPYYAAIAWLIRGADLDPYNGDIVTFNGNATTTVASGNSSPAPSVNSIFIGACVVNSSDSLTDGSGWNTTGANGFTSGMRTAARSDTYSATVDLFTEYKIASSAQSATWGGVGSVVSSLARVVSFKELNAGGAANMSGTGSMSAVGANGSPTGAASMAGVGSMAAAGIRVIAGAATMAGVATVAATTLKLIVGAASMSGTGSMSAVASLTGTVVSVWTAGGSGALSAVGGSRRAGAATMDGVGSMSAFSTALVQSGAATMAGTSTFDAIPEGVTPSHITASGTSGVAVVGQSGMWPESVKLTPSISDDGWGGELTYAWEQLSGPVPGATIVSPTGPSTEVKFLEIDGVYIFQFTVTRELDDLTSSTLFRVTIYTAAGLALATGPPPSDNNPVIVTANGATKSNDPGVRAKSIRISENSQGNNTCMMTMDGDWIYPGSEVIITRGGVRLFGGICTSLRVQYVGNLIKSYHPTMTGYAWHLGRMHVTKVYKDTQIDTIVRELVAMSPGSITIGFMPPLPITTISFDETPIDDALTQLTRLVPKLQWRVDHFRALHFATYEPGDPSPITLGHPNMKSLDVTKTINRTYNRIRVYYSPPVIPGADGDGPPIMEDGSIPGDPSPIIGTYDVGDTEIEIESLVGWNLNGGFFIHNGCKIYYTGIEVRPSPSPYGHITFNYLQTRAVEAGDGDFSWKNRTPLTDIWSFTDTLAEGMDIHKSGAPSHFISIQTPRGETPPVGFFGGVTQLQDWIGVAPHENGVGDPTGYYERHEHHESGFELWVLGMQFYDDTGTIIRVPPSDPAYNAAADAAREEVIAKVLSINIYRYSSEFSHPGDSLGQIFQVGSLPAHGGVFVDRIAKSNLAPITEPRWNAIPLDDGFGNLWYPWDDPPRYFLTGVTGICGKTKAETVKRARLFIEVNDLQAQSDLGVLLGGGDKGIIETSIEGGDISEADAWALGYALLAGLAKGLLMSATAALRDPNAHPGQMQSINLPWPIGTAELKIQGMNIQGFEMGVPHYNEITAATEIVTIEDILRGRK